MCEIESKQCPICASFTCWKELNPHGDVVFSSTIKPYLIDENNEYFSQIAAALKAVSDGCAKYMMKNPNAKYVDAHGKERPIAFALDSVRNHEKALIEAATRKVDETK